MADAVFGHYMQHGKSWQPLLPESSALFCDVVADRLAPAEAAVESDLAKVTQSFLVLHWGQDGELDSASNAKAGSQAAKASVNVKHRTLLMIAAYHGSLRVLSFLLSKGAEPSKKSPDGLTAYELALAGDSPQVATAVAMMKDADAHHLSVSSKQSSSSDNGTSYSALDNLRMSSQDLEESEGTSSASDLTRPEYATDDFRMFNFKVLRCSKRHAHDWRACPFAHPTENARRRDPREFRYCALACPDYKQGFCIRGDNCPYAHGVFECWLHPSRYRTQLCKDGANCHRPVCFFAHSLPELRAPTYTWVPGPEDLQRNNAAAAGMSLPGTAPAAALPGGPQQHNAQQQSGANGVAVAAAVAMSVPLPVPVSMSPPSGGSPQQPQGGAADSAAVAAGPSGGSSYDGEHSPLLAATLSSGSKAGGGNGLVESPVAHSPPTVIGSCRESPPVVNHHAADGGNSQHHSSCAGGGGKAGVPAVPGPGVAGHHPALPTVNLTQPNSAASMLGFTAPRMSNAFARRHGLNPKDNPMINLQKIALQSSSQAAAAAHNGMQRPHGTGGAPHSGGGYGSAVGYGDQPNGGGLRAAVGVGSVDGRHHHRAGSSGGGSHGRPAAAVAMQMSQQAMPANAYGLAYGTNGAHGIVTYGGHMHVAAPHMGQAAGGPQQAAESSSLLAMQLAQLNLHHQRQAHGMGGMGMAAAGMGGMAAAIAPTALQVQYMTTAGGGGPHHHAAAIAMQQQPGGGYGAVHHTAAVVGGYDPHLMAAAAMGGAQAEV